MMIDHVEGKVYQIETSKYTSFIELIVIYFNKIQSYLSLVVFNSGHGMFGLAASLSSKHFHLDAGTNVVLAAVENPGD